MLVEKPERILKTFGIAHIQSTILFFLKEITQNVKWKLMHGLFKELWVMILNGWFSSIHSPLFQGCERKTVPHPWSYSRPCEFPLLHSPNLPSHPQPSPHSDMEQPRVMYPDMEGSRPGKTSDHGRLCTARNKPLLDWAEEIWAVWYTSITCLILTEILSKGHYLTSLPFTGILRRKQDIRFH